MSARCGVEWDDHGDRGKPFRQAVVKTRSHDWEHHRVEGAATCLHTWEDAATFDQLNVGRLMFLEVAARRVDKPQPRECIYSKKQR